MIEKSRYIYVAAFCLLFEDLLKVLRKMKKMFFVFFFFFKFER